MTHEEAEDFSAAENSEFADLIWDSYGEEGVERAEEAADRIEFEVDTMKVYNALTKVTDFLAQQTDVFVVAAAVAMLHEELDRVCDEDD